MKIITEDLRNEFVVEEVLDEATGKKDLYISGIFMQQETKNRNGRVYPAAVMEKAVNKYIAEYVNTKRALGELNHPPSIQVNPERVSHLITELKRDGNNWIGKAKILDTPMGQIVKGIIKGGGSLGVSSRGVGSLKESNGVKIVQDDFSLATIDIVSDPSAHDAWVGGIYESLDYEWKDDTLVEVKHDDKKKSKVKKDVEGEIDPDLESSPDDTSDTNKKKPQVSVEGKIKDQIKAFESFMGKLTDL